MDSKNPAMKTPSKISERKDIPEKTEEIFDPKEHEVWLIDTFISS